MIQQTTRRISFLLSLLVLVGSASLAEAVQKSGTTAAEYRRHRSQYATTNHRRNNAEQRTHTSSKITTSKTRRRQAEERAAAAAAAKTTEDADSHSSSTSRKRRTRGVTRQRQNRRELSKSTGKSSSKSSSKSGSSGGSGGYNGSGGSRQQAGVGYNSDDGSYCGCLCFDEYDMDGVYNFNVACEYTAEPESYGYFQRQRQPSNSNSYLSNFFEYNRLTKWSETTNDYFTDYGYENQGWEYVDENNGNNNNNYNNNYNYGNNYYQGRYEDGSTAAPSNNGSAEGTEAVVAVVVEDLDSGYDPYQAFDIGSCDTYSHLWTYDLFASCADGNEFCECTYAIELMKMDLLSCSDLSSCPEECGVCSNCMHSVCDNFLPSQIVATGATGIHGNAAIVTAAFFGTVLMATCVALKRQQSEDQALKEKRERLVDDDGTPYTCKDWSVTLDASGQPVEDFGKKRPFWKKNRMETKPVWLAPDLSTVPVKPLFPDLLEGGPRKSRKQQEVEMANTRNANTGPVIVASGNQSHVSSISDGDSSTSSSSSRSDTSDDVDRSEQTTETRPDGKSLGSKEGEI